MAYRCLQAVFGRATDPIRCKVSGNVCAHQKMCMMEGRTVLTDGAMRCPGRDGQLPEPVAEIRLTAPQKTAAPVEARKTAPAKTAGRKTAAKTTAKTSTRKTAAKKNA